MAELVNILTSVPMVIVTLVTTVTIDPKVIMVTLVTTVPRSLWLPLLPMFLNGYSYVPLRASVCGYFVTLFNVSIYSPLKGELQNETLLLTMGRIRIK